MTQPPSPLYLHKLPSLGEMFSFLNSGKHLNRLADHALWAELEREQDAYETLFNALGYQLRIDGRGFAWFHFDDASNNVNRMTRHLALLFMLLFEYQADTGLNLGRFTEWIIDEALLAAILDKNRILLEAEGLADREQLGQIMKTATNYGFATAESAAWRLLPAVFRYLDHFEELASQTEISENTDEIMGEIRGETAFTGDLEQ